MASLTNDPGNLRRVLFRLNGKRRTIRLGRLPQRDAETVLGHVEALLVAHEHGTPTPASTAAWLAGLSDEAHDRIARVGLVPRRGAVTLGELLDRYVATAVVKKSTADARRQTTNSLTAHFTREKPLNEITPADADAWRRAITDAGLAPATVSKRTHVAKAVFRKAVRWGLLASNPFADLKAGPQTNPARIHYVSPDAVTAVLDACPDDQWRAVFALSRYAGLRCPSEIVGLRWGNMNWERGRLTVLSPKTAGHGDGHAVRVVPLTPKLRGILLSLFNAADDGAEYIVPRLRDPRTNLRTTATKIVTRAGVTPWPKLFHNLRASCAMDWCERFPAHVAASWLGHSPLIAARHYLTSRDAHFDHAAGLAPTEAAQNPAHSAHARGCTELHGAPDALENAGENDVLQSSATPCTTFPRQPMGVTGLEPVTSSV